MGSQGRPGSGLATGPKQPLHQGHVVRPFDLRAGRLGEMGDLHGPGQAQQFVLAVQQGEPLAAVSGDLRL